MVNVGLHDYIDVALGIGSAASIIGSVFVAYYLSRHDEDKKAVAKAIDDICGKVETLERRHGYEISDSRIAVAPLFTKAGLDQPVYPSR